MRLFIDLYLGRNYSFLALNPDVGCPSKLNKDGCQRILVHREKLAQELNPFQLDSKAPSQPLEQYVYREGRYRMLTQSHPDTAARLLELAKADVATRWESYARLAGIEKA